jgi:hypothetical protein
VAFVYNGTEGSIIAGPIANAALRAYFEIVKGIDLVEPPVPVEGEPGASPTPVAPR